MVWVCTFSAVLAEQWRPLVTSDMSGAGVESGVSETSESPEPGERGRDQGHRIHGMDASVGGKSGVFW